jgi:hypothetical protein
MKRVGVLLVIMLSLVPAFYLNRWLQQIIQPRKSFVRLLLYILTAFVLVFLYTFVIVWCIAKLFPIAKP